MLWMSKDDLEGFLFNKRGFLCYETGKLKLGQQPGVALQGLCWQVEGGDGDLIGC